MHFSNSFYPKVLYKVTLVVVVGGGTHRPKYLLHRETISLPLLQCSYICCAMQQLMAQGNM